MSKPKYTYPHNPTAEKSLLACLLMDNAVAGKVLEKHTYHIFYNKTHQNIYKACKDLYTTDTVVDIVAVADQMEINKTKATNTFNYLTELITFVPSALMYENYLKIVVRDWQIRGIIDKCNEILKVAYETNDFEETSKMAEKLIYEISVNENNTELEHISTASLEYLARVDRMMSSKTVYKGLLTGLNTYDLYTNGLHRGEMTILAARPSVGKTALALNIVANIIASGKKKNIAFFSLEMPKMQLAQRLISTIGNISMSKTTRATFDSSEMARVWSANSKLANSKLFIDDTSMLTPSEALSKCRRLAVKEGKLDLVVIDYLQLMSNAKTNRSNREQEVAEMSRMLKVMAKELNCPVIVLSQMSRDIERRSTRKPSLSDLRESGAIEQDADIVLFLSRENEDDKETKTQYAVNLDIAKHRNGRCGRVPLWWNGDIVQFLEAEKDEWN